MCYLCRLLDNEPTEFQNPSKTRYLYIFGIIHGQKTALIKIAPGQTLKLFLSPEARIHMAYESVKQTKQERV